MRRPARFALIPLVLLALPVAAQGGGGLAILRCAPADEAGTVRGTVVDDSTGLPVSRAHVDLRPLGCITTADEAGRFEMHPVGPGRYAVHVNAGPGYGSSWDLATIEVRAGSVTEVTLRVAKENRVADCLRNPACAAVLAPAPLPPELTEEERLEEVAWRTIYAMSGRGGSLGWIPCADVASDRVRNALLARIPALAPWAECEGPTYESPGIVHRATGSVARKLRLSRVIVEGDRSEVRANDRSAYMAGAMWTCRFARIEGQWTPLRCWTTGYL